MEVAILSLTRGGGELGARLQRLLQEEGVFARVDLYRREDCAPSFKETVVRLWPRYRAFVFIMATGIVVRTIAPLLRDKREDPAVVVMDEAGRFVISLLSGHMGGANRLAETIARLAGATPVITTATDVLGLPAVEVLALDRGLKIENFAAVKRVNAALSNGERVIFYTDMPAKILFAGHSLPPGVEIRPEKEYRPDRKEGKATVVITHRLLPPAEEEPLVLRPPCLVAGVGCRRGTPAAEITAALVETMTANGLSPASLRKIASAELKTDERGLIEAALSLNVPLEFHSLEKIKELYRRRPDLTVSPLVQERIGVGGVCEAASLLSSSPDAPLLVPRTKKGRVTVAVALVKSWWWG